MNLFESRGIVVVAVVLEFVYLILCSRYVFWHVGKTAVGEGSEVALRLPLFGGGGAALVSGRRHWFSIVVMTYHESSSTSSYAYNESIL